MAERSITFNNWFNNWFTVPRVTEDQAKDLAFEVRDTVLAEHNMFARMMIAERMTAFELVEAKLGEGHGIALVRGLSQNTIEVGWSFCSPKDPYDVMKGIIIAHGRLVKKPVTLVDVDLDNPTAVFTHMMTEAPGPYIPVWVERYLLTGK